MYSKKRRRECRLDSKMGGDIAILDVDRIPCIRYTHHETGKCIKMFPSPIIMMPTDDALPDATPTLAYANRGGGWSCRSRMPPPITNCCRKASMTHSAHRDYYQLGDSSSPSVLNTRITTICRKPRQNHQVHPKQASMMAPTTISGGCLCEGVRYTITFPADHDFTAQVNNTGPPFPPSPLPPPS